MRHGVRYVFSGRCERGFCKRGFMLPASIFTTVSLRTGVHCLLWQRSWLQNQSHCYFQRLFVLLGIIGGVLHRKICAHNLQSHVVSLLTMTSLGYKHNIR